MLPRFQDSVNRILAVYLAEAQAEGDERLPGPPSVQEVKNQEPGSASPPKLNDSPAIPFRRPAGREDFEFPCCSPLGRDLLPQLLAGLTLAVKRLCYHRRTAHVTQPQYPDFEVASIVGDLQDVAHPYLPRRFGHLPVRSNPPKIARLPGQRPGLKKTRRPKPCIDPCAAHKHHFPTTWAGVHNDAVASQELSPWTATGNPAKQSLDAPHSLS